tara:strand:- start:163 stop:279 length:117 start_codon:yes stop_codon:yes gene_type:complete
MEKLRKELAKIVAKIDSRKAEKLERLKESIDTEGGEWK